MCNFCCAFSQYMYNEKKILFNPACSYVHYSHSQKKYSFICASMFWIFGFVCTTLIFSLLSIHIKHLFAYSCQYEQLHVVHQKTKNKKNSLTASTCACIMFEVESFHVLIKSLQFYLLVQKTFFVTHFFFWLQTLDTTYWWLHFILFVG